MKIAKKDWLFIALVAGVLIVFFAISGEEKTKKVPYDENHKPSYEIFKQTGSKMEADKGCPQCHNEQGGIPFPANHPVKPKEGPSRCLFCHKLQKI
ncbi:cytochrome C [Geobacter sp. DSM 9736]|uniref:cytochrome C n=1 Tax=Geobacter sp. DSM 9736 TaxID=1277350 RepID=UPI000B50984B|nr:cytochrome C [Geobacter sp. DSM 9736]SNB47882.1 hypothetical protein SAMN06269301_3376 [Geobacter sp. DSM 9736]